MSKNNKPVYLFDFTGEPMGRFADIKHLAKKIRRSESSVSTGLKRCGLVDSRFLVSYSDEVVVPYIMSNPMFSNIRVPMEIESISDEDAVINRHIDQEFKNLRSNWQDVLATVRSNKEYYKIISDRLVK